MKGRRASVKKNMKCWNIRLVEEIAIQLFCVFLVNSVHANQSKLKFHQLTMECSGVPSRRFIAVRPEAMIHIWKTFLYIQLMHSKTTSLHCTPNLHVFLEFFPPQKLDL